MKIYIASSWKNQHAVEMLTDLLRALGHEVLSFVENNHNEGHGAEKPVDFEAWVRTEQAARSFAYDTTGTTESDLVIYIGPSGTDAWAEVGAAWASGVMIFGLWAKGEPAGLMRGLVDKWFTDYRQLLEALGTGLFHTCKVCGYTDDPNRPWIDKVSTPVRHWVEEDLCSACAAMPQQPDADDALVNDFLNECCILETGSKAKVRDLYVQFCNWYIEGIGRIPPAAAWLGKALSKKFDKTKEKGSIFYVGVSIKDRNGLDDICVCGEPYCRKKLQHSTIKEV